MLYISTRFAFVIIKCYSTTNPYMGTTKLDTTDYTVRLVTLWGKQVLTHLLGFS